MSDTPDVRRQVVTFTMYRLDPAARRLPAEEREAIKAEFVEALASKPDDLILLTYSTAGLKADADLVIWRIAFDLEALQAQEAALNRTRLAGYLSTSQRFVSMTKRSQYIDPVDPFHDENSRTRIVPGRRKYLFVYPFVKTREWYLLPIEERQKVMTEHIRVGNDYPSVKLNTTYSFGLDDQDFVVAFETDEAADFLDLVQSLRETESSLFTVRDTPMFTCVRKDARPALDDLL
jgi:chlorite dismutase